MRIKAPAVLVLVAVAAGCGGGGGGGSQSPGAIVLFPPPDAVVSGDELVVTGRAEAAGGVATVEVNGVAASTSDGFVTWRARIPLAPGRNGLTVRVVSNGGVEAPRAVETRVRAIGRLLGRLRDLAVDAPSRRAFVCDQRDGVFLVDLAAGHQLEVTGTTLGSGPALAEPISVAYDAASDRLYVLDDDGSRVVSVDVVTGTRSVLAAGSQGMGPAVSLVRDLVLDAAGGRLLGAGAFAGSGHEGRVVAIDEFTGDRTEISGPQRGSGPGLSSTLQLAVSPAGRIAVLDQGNHDLLTIDPATGDRTQVADLSPSGAQLRGIDFDGTEDGVLATADETLIAIDLTSGAVTIVADATTGAGRRLATPQAVRADPATGSALVQLDSAVVSVDLATGDRTSISDARRGAGPDWAVPREVLFERTSGRLFAFETQQGELREVDAGSGDRVATVAVQPDFAIHGPSAVDSRRARLLTVGLETTPGGRRGLFAFDLATGARTHVSDQVPVTDFDAVAGLEYDAENDLAVFLESSGTLKTLDLASGVVSLVSSQTRGVGPPLFGADDLALDAGAGRAIVAAGGAVFGVDLATGDRTELSGTTRGTGPSLFGLDRMAVDERTNRAFGLIPDASALVTIDLATGDRSVLADSSGGADLAFPLDVALDIGTGTPIVSFFGRMAGLSSFEPETGQRAILSR